MHSQHSPPVLQFAHKQSQSFELFRALPLKSNSKLETYQSTWKTGLEILQNKEGHGFTANKSTQSRNFTIGTKKPRFPPFVTYFFPAPLQSNYRTFSGWRSTQKIGYFAAASWVFFATWTFYSPDKPFLLSANISHTSLIFCTLFCSRSLNICFLK